MSRQFLIPQKAKNTADTVASCCGYALIAVSWFVLGAGVTGWTPAGIDALIYSGWLYSMSAILIACCGLVTLTAAGKAIDVISLLAMAGVWGSLYLGHRMGPQHPQALQDGFRWISLAWACCFAILWLFSIPAEPVCKSLLLMFFALGCLASAFGEWMHFPEATWLGGVIFLISSVLSALTAVSEGWRRFKVKKSAPAADTSTVEKRFVIHFKF